MKKALILANGELNDGVMVQRALASAVGVQVIAADGGAHLASELGLTLHTVIGDMDSVQPDFLTELIKKGVEVQRYPPEKDATDLELTLRYAALNGYSWLRIIGGIGGRFDQTIANIYLLSMPYLLDCDIEFVSGNQSIYLLKTGQNQLVGEVNDTISLIPLAGDVNGISTVGLKYPLQNETLRFGPARGVSNVMLRETASVSIRSGVLLCVHTVGRA